MYAVLFYLLGFYVINYITDLVPVTRPEGEIDLLAHYCYNR